MNKTTMENVTERFREVELHLASLGTTPLEQGAPKEYKRGWFFWLMTLSTCGGWWVVFGNNHTSINNDKIIKWTEESYQTMLAIKHEEKLKATLEKVKK